jgi:endoglucanase
MTPKPPRLPHPRRPAAIRVRALISALVAIALAGVGWVAVTTSAAAAVACKVTYTKNDWGSGFTADLTIQNLGDALSGWTLRYSYSGNQRLQSGWNGTWSQSGQDVTVTNAAWNGNVATGASVSTGAQFSYSGTNTDPTSFSVNNVTCTGSVPTTTPPTTPTTTPPTTSPPPSSPPPGTAPVLHVSGNKLVDAGGRTVVLHGVNRSGGEFACIQGNGMWDGPVDQASIDAIRTWNIKAVRIPLNEECWLGSSDVPAGGTSGTAYQQAVKSYVTLLLNNGITPIVEMHWNFGQYTGPGGNCTDVKATCQKPMPDAQFAPSFWTGVANAFKGDNRVVFDLFNEPFPDAAVNFSDPTEAWNCFLNGGTCTGISYQVAGFQSLVNAVRATGATNVILLGGLAWSNDLSQWLQHKPTDPTGNLAAFGHVYNFNSCSNASCWDSTFGAVAAQVPLTLSEIGENDCAHGFIDTLMNWADSHGVGYLGWTWNTWPCTSGPALISSYDGTPTNFGVGFRDHLRSLP